MLVAAIITNHGSNALGKDPLCGQRIVVQKEDISEHLKRRIFCVHPMSDSTTNNVLACGGRQ